MLVNGYGPTENTTFSATHALRAWTRWRGVGAHRPADSRTRTAVRAGRGTAAGAGGRAGRAVHRRRGLAWGYLNRPELTAERFVPTPSARAGRAAVPHGRPGALAADGTLEFLGRIDFQVKVRGFRIELGEIEAALRAAPGVREAVVAGARGRRGDKRLVAYVVGEADGTSLEAAALRSTCGSGCRSTWCRRPSWCWTRCRSTPTARWTARRCPRRRRTASGSDRYVAPRTAVGGAAGGHLGGGAGRGAGGRARQLLRAGRPLAAGDPGGVARPRGAAAWSCRCAPSSRRPRWRRWRERLRGQRRASARLRAAESHRARRAAAAVVRAAAPVVPRSAGARDALYNMPVALRLDGALDVEALRRAPSRHWSAPRGAAHDVPRDEGQPVQRHPRRGGVCRSTVRGPRRPAGGEQREAEARRRLGAEARGVRSTWSTGPLLRATLLRLGADEHVLLRDDAPHRLRRLVAWACSSASWRRLRGASREARRRRCRSCRCSTRTTRRGSASWLRARCWSAARLLEAAARGSTRGAGAAHGPSAAARCSRTAGATMSVAAAAGARRSS